MSATDIRPPVQTEEEILRAREEQEIADRAFLDANEPKLLDFGKLFNTIGLWAQAIIGMMKGDPRSRILFEVLTGKTEEPPKRYQEQGAPETEIAYRNDIGYYHVQTGEPLTEQERQDHNLPEHPEQVSSTDPDAAEPLAISESFNSAAPGPEPKTGLSLTFDNAVAAIDAPDPVQPDIVGTIGFDLNQKMSA